LPPSEAEKLYRSILTATTSYLDEMEAPREYIDIWTSTSSEDLRWTMEVTDFRSPSFAEWVDASCSALMPVEERAKLTELQSIRSKDRTSSEAFLANMLEEKRTKKWECEYAVLFRARKKVPLSRDNG
jgi:hypothetical protein